MPQFLNSQYNLIYFEKIKLFVHLILSYKYNFYTSNLTPY